MHRSTPTKGKKKLGHLAGLGNALLLALAGASPAAAQCQYEVVATITGPECTPGDFASFSITSLDESGNAAGAVTCVVTPAAAVWTGGAIANPLTNPPGTNNSFAFDLSDPNHIVGRALPSGSTLDIAAYWENGQGMLLPLLPSANSSVATAINSSSQIVGFNNNSIVGPLKAFLWESGDIEALVLPFGIEAVANDLNESGQVTGWMGASVILDAHAYIWDNGVVTDLGVIPRGVSAIGNAINNHGHVAGHGWIPDGLSTFGNQHAYYWDGKRGFDLGTLPNHKRSRALDINDLDQIIGDSSFVGDDPNMRTAELWEQGSMHVLNDLVTTDLGTAFVNGAVAINNDGLILAGTTAGDIILLAPVGSAQGDIDNNCFVDVTDLLLLLGEWGQGNSFADTNADGDVNVTDLLQVLRDWG